METYLAILLILMILGALYALQAKDLLSAVISFGIIGFALVICFLLLQAPDLAIVLIALEIISLVIMIGVILNTTREELKEKFGARSVIYFICTLVFASAFLYFFNKTTGTLTRFGEHFTRMATTYIDSGAEMTGSANLVTGILFDFRGYDTLGEATILFTAAIGVLTILRLKGSKEKQQ